MAILIPDVFSDPMRYLKAEHVLRRLFDRIKCEDYTGPMWTQWMNRTFINGTRPYDDSMPVYTQYCEARQKGIAIWLKDPEEMEGYGFQPETFFRARLELWDPDVTRIDKLDISCVLSEENMERAETLLRLYIIDDVSPAALSAIIEERGLGFG